MCALEEPLSRGASRTVQWSTQQGSGPQNETRSGTTTTTNGLTKVNGLIKKTITVTIDGSDLHLISYYTQEDIQSRRLRRISSRPDITILEMQPHLFRFSNFRNPPKVVIGRDGSQTIVCEPEEAEPLERLTEELPDPASYHSERPDGIEEDRHPSGRTAPSRGSNVVISNDHAHRDEWRGQLDSTRMGSHEVRRDVYGLLDSSSGVQHSYGHVDRSHPDSAYALRSQHEPQSWPAPLHEPSARYELSPLSMPYLHRSVAREAETETASSGQTSMVMKGMSNEEHSLYGSQARYIVDAREVGDHHPSTWLSANQRETRQLPGDPNSFSAPRPPSSSNPSHFSTMQENTDNSNMWPSNRHDSESYSVQLQYLQSESYPGAIQIPSRNIYGNQTASAAGGGSTSFKMEENDKKYIGH